MSKRWAAFLTAFLALALVTEAGATLDVSHPDVIAPSDGTASGLSGTSLYMIELKGEPAATYEGGVAGLPATSVQATGATQLDSNAPATVAYVRVLLAHQSDFAAELNKALGRDVHVQFNYRYVLNGVAVELTEAEADIAATLPTVTAVEKSREFHVETDAGPKWIGAPGIWNGSMVPGGTATMGEGIVVGIIDTGINTDHPSFAAVGGDGYVHQNPYGEGHYKGYCDPENEGHDPEKYKCNSKLVGMWSFEASGNDAEDDNGHGSHTAGTAAGNVITASLIAPTIVVTSPLQGVAPHANIIAYDVCSNTGSCAQAAIVAALDQAVDDQVEVTNYSIGGGGDNDEPWSDSNLGDKGWRNVRAAGIWAATSAGNAGPGPATTQKIGPWLTGVGASTHNRSVENSLINMTGGGSTPPADMVGKSLSSGYGPAPIVYAAGRLHEDGTPDDGQCNTPFPAGTFANVEIVACDRGIIARVDKGTNVLAGGAGGLVLMNMAANGNSVVGDAHYLPAVHIGYDAGVVLKAWLATGTGHMATISGTRFNLDPGNGDIMASFSSRGWSLINTCCIRDWGLLGTRWVDLLKPDVTAPGVDIWAPASTDQADPAPEAEFQLLSGTSMSGPHVAGAFALLRALHPEWTPAQGQSALMLTSVTEGVRKEDGVTPADPFDRGAGRINVSNAANAAFVLDMTMDEAMSQNPSTGGDPSTLNVASMANFRCLGTCSWTRTIKSVWADEVDWTVMTEGASGLSVSVEPTSFTLAPGASQTLTVTADVTEVVTDTYAFGEVDFQPEQSGPNPAHMPVVVRAPLYALPYTVVSETPAYAIARGPGHGTWKIDGIKSVALDDITVEPLGLVLPEVASVEVGQDTNANPWDGITGTSTVFFDQPEGAVRLTTELRGSAAQNANLWLGQDANGDGIAQQAEARCASQSAGNWDLCTLFNPAPAGPWWILIHNVTSSAPDAIDQIAVHRGSVMHGAGSLEASVPASADGTAPWAIDLSWDQTEAVEAGGVLYGAVIVSVGGQPLITMQVDVNTTESPPAVYLPDLSKGYIRGGP